MHVYNRTIWYDPVMEEFWTLGEVARQLSLSKATIRNWSGPNGEFADYLSASATPDKGEVRKFTEPDLKVLWYVQTCRLRDIGYQEIHKQLKTGQHETVEMVLSPLPVDSNEDEPTAAELRGLIQALEEERDWLRTELTKTRTEQLAAERRAVEAETKLSLLSNRKESST